MGKRQFILSILLSSILGAAIAIGGYHFLAGKQEPVYQDFEERQKVVLSSFGENYTAKPKIIVPEGLNFVHAAKQATPGVVHIRSEYKEDSDASSRNPIYDYFGFGNPDGRRSRATGSGVIISDDGYIVTNNHVVEDANGITVTLNNNMKYEARVIGTDPSTDLALIKIDDSNLPFVAFGDSDNLEIGEWVLAIGNPFDLTSTVTAGIVSARSRNINILRDPNGRQIESFIQTDAVVNPGNSGGALINLNGELVGINTAIASPTGSYTGYSFAVPVTLVKKVMNDLKLYGQVQRALLGVNILDIEDPRIEEKLDVLQGIYISGVTANSGAEDAGLETGDIIIGIDDKKVNNVAELQEKVAQNSPGTKIDITFLRNGKERTVQATLKNVDQGFDIIERSHPLNLAGARLEDLSTRDKTSLGIRNGAKITDLKEGKWQKAGIKEGFIITSVDKEQVENVKDLEEILEEKDGTITILGLYPDGTKDYFSLRW